jgi:hypothetical protein
MRPLSAAFAFVLLAAAGCSTSSKPAATPTPTPAPLKPSAAAPPSVDVTKLPPAHQADAAQLAPDIASSLVFIQSMLEEHKPTMEKVTCYCCGKSLAQCYLDTATKAAKACSPL